MVTSLIIHGIISVAQSLNHVWLFATLWTIVSQTPLSSTISKTVLKFMSNELVMLPNHLIPCFPLLLLPSIFPKSRSFPMTSLFSSGGQSIRASAIVLSMDIQGWFPLGLTSLISLLSKGLSGVLLQHHNLKASIFSPQPSLYPPLTSIHYYWKNHSFGYMDLCRQSNISAF